MIKKIFGVAGLSALLAFGLAACGEEESTATDPASTQAAEPAEEKVAEQTITYLGEEYSVPGEVERIVAASLESMEDAAILGIKPVGALAIGNDLPAYLAEEMEGAELIGDKFAPNNEAVLALEPDVILGSSKHGEEVVTAMNKIQTMIPYSHISTNWKENLQLLGQLTGKETEADTILADYDQKAADAQAELSEEIKGETTIVIRVRQGSMNVYPEGVYLNPVLYEDLGLVVPEAITKAEAQAELSLEALAEINPQTIFLQFETSENTDQPEALDELMENPIFQSLDAAKNDRVFINAVDPMAQGGTAWSKVKFLDAAIEYLSE